MDELWGVVVFCQQVAAKRSREALTDRTPGAQELAHFYSRIALKAYEWAGKS